MQNYSKNVLIEIVVCVYYTLYTYTRVHTPARILAHTSKRLDWVDLIRTPNMQKTTYHKNDGSFGFWKSSLSDTFTSNLSQHVTFKDCMVTLDEAS